MCQSDRFRFEEPSGPYGVGLKVVEQYDHSRVFRYCRDGLGDPYLGECARPLQTLIWYPAERSEREHMTVGDYGNLCATETHFGKPKMSANAKEFLSGMKAALSVPLRAVKDALIVEGRFPVVIYAPSFSAPSWENADLCEYFASHGYLVLATPSVGVVTRNMTSDLAGINAQARDISYLIGYAAKLENSDMSQVCVVGFSWGGIANVFAASQDSRIKALIVLDGSLRFSPGIVRQAGHVHPDEMSIPLLSIAQGQWTREEQDRQGTDNDRSGPNVLNAWTHGDLIAIYMLAMAHGEFASMYQRNEHAWRDVFKPWHQKKAGYDREDAAAGYAWMARYALQFLNAYLKNDRSGLSFLRRTPAQNGVPRHVMATDFRAAVGVPASFDGFREELGRRGFENAGEIYSSLQKKKPGFELDEELLISWSEELMEDQHLVQAIILLELNARTHENSSRAYATLGYAYQQSRRNEQAVNCYRTALEKDSDNIEAKRRLWQLQGVS